MGMLRTFTRRRRNWAVGLALSGIAAMAIVTVSEAGGGAPPAAASTTPGPSATATAPATATPTVASAPTPPPPPPAAVEPKPVPPGTKVTADAARVLTGDGDCLNVRPNPGTTFAVEPYSCVPEGTLLWLSGPTEEADGERWRFALGQGWVALRYTVAEKAPAVRLPAGGRLATWELGAYPEPKPGTAPGQDVLVAVTDLRGGSAPAQFVFPGYGNGLGARNPEISPNGRYIAFNGSGELGSTAIIGDLSDGSVKRIEGWFGIGWSQAGRLMLERQTTCDPVCLMVFATYDPLARAVTALTEEPSQMAFVAWSADGTAGYFRREGGGELVRIDLAGKVAKAGTIADEDRVWAGLASPDGRYVLGAGGLNALTLLDLANSKASKFTRAPQRELPGKCGGSWSQVFGWVDGSRIFYHERSSSSRADGVTIGDLATGKRVVYPFYNVQDLSSPAPGLLSFATWVSEKERSYTVTFVLDLGSGQAMPLVAGSGGTWVR